MLNSPPMLNGSDALRTTLTIAGSDSSGGAGIQADIKTFTALGTYGMSVLTAVTAQNTFSVEKVLEVPCDMVIAQLEAVYSDINIHALKTGMLVNKEIIEAISSFIANKELTNVVIDPVMLSTSNRELLQPQAVDTLINKLVPLSTVITPNIPEAEKLCGMSINSEIDIKEAARRIHAKGTGFVLIKGGHLEGDAVDILYDGRNYSAYRSPRIGATEIHGTGCTLSAAITAFLARGEGVEDAVAKAKEYINEAILHSFLPGHGARCLYHAVTRV